MSGFDDVWFRAIYGGSGGSSPSSLVFWSMVVLTIVGGGWGLVGLAPLLAFRHTRGLAIFLLGTLAANSLVINLIKALVGRVRPYRALTMQALFDAPHDPSFPSGHAAGSFATFVFFACVWLSASTFSSKRAAALALLLLGALGTGISRVYLGVHYPSDVIAGVIIGSLFGSLGAFLHRRMCATGETSKV